MFGHRLVRAMVLIGGLSLAASGCGNNPGEILESDANPGADSGADSGSLPCINLQCQQVSCPGGGTTTISGVVNIPAGNLPLPNVIVYVPNAPVGPIAEGLTCDRCDAPLPGSPLVRTTTDLKGQFTLENMPVGTDIPVVLQVGKWRRQITIPAVDACTDNPVEPVLTRLPRNRQEGDIPRIALTTGGADALECLLRKIGIDDSEFTPESQDGRVNFYVGRNGSDRYAPALNSGALFTRARDWWSSLDNLLPYDIVIHSCEGSQDANNKSQAARQALQDYSGMGGRVFLSHWHNIWLEGGPSAFQSVATWNHQDNPPSPTTGYIDQSFEKGRTLAEWMLEVAGSTALGEMVIRSGRRTLGVVNQAVAQRWIWIAPGGVQSDQYISFNTPVGAAENQQCGRIVFSDIHVSSGDTSRDRPFPTGCTSVGLTPQEKALVYMLFDISACIVPDIIIN